MIQDTRNCLLCLLILPCAMFAQSDVRVTAQTLSQSTTRAMFGRLPKAVTAASVQTCNQTPNALTVPLERLVQQVKLTNGLTILPRDAALVVVSQAQGSGRTATALRYLGAGASTVGVLTALQVIKPGTGWGAAVVLWTTVAGVIGQQYAGAATTHNLLAISSEALPDPLLLAPAGCVSGIALVESDPSAKSLDIVVPIK
jgi:hypothetical protein